MKPHSVVPLSHERAYKYRALQVMLTIAIILLLLFGPAHSFFHLPGFGAIINNLISEKVCTKGELSVQSLESGTYSGGVQLLSANIDKNWLPTPFPNGYNLTSVYMLSANEGWAVGWAGTILHYKDGCWQGERKPFSLDSPAPQLNSIYMLSPDEGWAVGNMGTVLHYQYGDWSDVPGLLEYDLNSVYMTSINEGWAVGGSDGVSGTSTSSVIFHYNNGKWNSIDPVTTEPLYNLQMVSADEGWAVGGSDNIGGRGASTSLILHYYGGTWTKVSSPTDQPLHSLRMISSKEGWASGRSGIGKGAILHYQNNQWSFVRQLGQKLKHFNLV